MHLKATLWLGCAIAALVIAGCDKDDSGDGQQDATACTPTTCAAEGKDCGSMPDGCGQVLSCGTCTAPQVCGAGGVANVCGDGTCTPTTCVAEGKDCGTISDGCGDVLECGSCTAPETCGGGGVDNVCGGSGPGPDAGPPGPDAGPEYHCDPTCMAQSGAVCCVESCNCPAPIDCFPVCEEGFQWDCEIRCCFNYTTYQCQ